MFVVIYVDVKQWLEEKLAGDDDLEEAGRG